MSSMDNLDLVDNQIIPVCSLIYFDSIFDVILGKKANQLDFKYVIKSSKLSSLKSQNIISSLVKLYHLNNDEVPESNENKAFSYYCPKYEINKELSLDSYSDMITVSRKFKVFTFLNSNERYIRVWGGELQHFFMILVPIDCKGKNTKDAGVIVIVHQVEEDYECVILSNMRSHLTILIENLIKNDEIQVKPQKNKIVERNIEDFLKSYIRTCKLSGSCYDEQIATKILDKKVTSRSSTKSLGSSQVLNYKYMDLNTFNKYIPFTESEFSSVERLTPNKLLEKDQLNQTNFYKTYMELCRRVELKWENTKKAYIDNSLLVRYAVGFNGNTERAWDFLQSLVEFKEDYLQNKLGYSLPFLKEEVKKNLISNIGSDIYGRPILLIKAKYFNPKQMEKEHLVDLLVLVLEETLKKLPKNIDKVLLMADLTGVNSSNSSLPHMKLIQEIMNKYYVERMANMIIINKGLFFTFIWKIIKSFLPERVINKIIIIDESKKPMLKHILGDLYNQLHIK